MYDLVVYGSVLPVLMKEWSVDPVAAGAIGSYGIFGMMVGAILFGILADRLVRTGVALFSVATALCSFADAPWGPANLLLLVSQYYPSFMRSTAIGLASGVGRMGAVVGPMFGGVLLALSLPVEMNFLFAIPGVFAALAFLFVPLAKGKAREASSTGPPRRRPRSPLRELTAYDDGGAHLGRLTHQSGAPSDGCGPPSLFRWLPGRAAGITSLQGFSEPGRTADGSRAAW